MAGGRANKLAGQVGEYLVAAELARRGLIATTFTGNVPHFDIIATSERGSHVLVQVKAATKDTWQFNMASFCAISFRGNVQRVGRPRKCPVLGLFVVLVRIRGTGADQFFVLSWEDLRNVAIRHHREFLRIHGGVRPRNPRSTHVAIKVSELSLFEDKWHLLTPRTDASQGTATPR